jgi:hypothetical protein
MRYPNTLTSCSQCDTFLAPGATSCPTCGASASSRSAARNASVAVAVMGLTVAALSGCGDDGGSSASTSTTSSAAGAGGAAAGGSGQGGSDVDASSIASTYGVGPTGSGGGF